VGVIYEGPAVTTQPVSVTYRYSLTRFEPRVSVGDSVLPGDVIARKSVSQPLVMVDVADAMNKKRKSVGRNIAVEEGAQIERGQRIAAASGPFGFGKREVASPVDGTVEAVLHEQALVVLRPPDSVDDVLAGVAGIITRLSANGVDIEANGFAIRGIVGSGEETYGLLRLLSSDSTFDAFSAPGAAATPAVVVSRVGVSGDDIDRIIAAWKDGAVSALVVPCVSRRDFERVRSNLPPLALIATEGFAGPQSGVAMHDSIWSTLTRFDGRPVAVDPGSDGNGSNLPVILIPSDGGAARAPGDSVPLSDGVDVRGLSGMSLMAGRLAEVLPGTRPLESGHVVAAAAVTLDDQSRVLVAVDGLEPVSAGEV
jgi:hypothetical protein